MPRLHTSTPAWGLGDLSPFVVKVQAWCDIKGIAWERGDGNPNKAPKGKIPWWTADDGTEVADSSDIIDYLIARHGPLPGDARTPHNRGVGHLVRRTAEEHVYWGLGWHRWLAPGNLALQEEAFAPLMPRWVGGLIVRRVIYPQLEKALKAHGLGRHAPTQIAARIREDLDAIGAVLGDAPYFGGDSPCTLDATVWAMVASILLAPHRSPVWDAVNDSPRWTAYVERFRGKLPTAWPG